MAEKGGEEVDSIALPASLLLLVLLPVCTCACACTCCCGCALWLCLCFCMCLCFCFCLPVLVPGLVLVLVLYSTSQEAANSKCKAGEVDLGFFLSFRRKIIEVPTHRNASALVVIDSHQTCPL